MRETRERFQIGEYWLGQVDGSTAWYAFWFDSGKRRTCRRSLGTVHEKEARLKLAEHVLKYSRPKEAAPSSLSIMQVVSAYFDDHANDKASATQAKIAAAYIGDWWELRKVSDITPTTQQDFIKHLGEQGLAPGSIRRYLTVFSAALRRAVKMGMLTSAPQIILSEAEIGEITKAPGKIKERRLDVKEIATFIDAIKSPHFFRYVMLALTTLARPDAITDLTIFQTTDTLIDLNPPGRRQNKKFRPVVPAGPTIAAWLTAWKEADRKAAQDPDEKKRKVIPANIVHYKGKPVANTKKAFRETAIAAGLMIAGEASRPDVAVTPYTLRRSMARLLRAEGVPMADIGAQLGHAIPGVSTTEIYADADPNYLRTVVEGIESILDKVEAHTKRVSIRAQDRVCDQVETKSGATKRLRVV